MSTTNGSNVEAIETRKDIFAKSCQQVLPKELDKFIKSMSKIKINDKINELLGIGFFVEYNLVLFLITNYHIIAKTIKNIEIEIWNKNKIELYLINREIIY